MLAKGTLLSSRYRIDSVLGQGGMGAVYLAEMEALGDKKVALKEMELQGLPSQELAQAVRQFRKEASFLAHLDHPNLVKVSDFFVEDGKHYLVMAYVPGETLQQKLMALGRPFTWSELKGWAEKLVDVLCYLHQQDPPILFRDLKPSNIMISNSGHLRLIDFGIARVAQTGDRTSTFLQGTGTRGFSPIEQYGGGQSTDERSDIYALGATLYYLLTGRLPADAVERVSQGQQLEAASNHQPSLPSGMDRLLFKALALPRADRHQSMEEFKREMSALGSKVVDDDGSTEAFGVPVHREKPSPEVVSEATVGRSHPYWHRTLRFGTAAAACLVFAALGLSPLSSETLGERFEGTQLAKADNSLQPLRVPVSSVGKLVLDQPVVASEDVSLRSAWVEPQSLRPGPQSQESQESQEQASNPQPEPVPQTSRPRLGSEVGKPVLSLGQRRYPKAKVRVRLELAQQSTTRTTEAESRPPVPPSEPRHKGPDKSVREPRSATTTETGPPIHTITQNPNLVISPTSEVSTPAGSGIPMAAVGEGLSAGQTSPAAIPSSGSPETSSTSSISMESPSPSGSSQPGGMSSVQTTSTESGHRSSGRASNKEGGANKRGGSRGDGRGAQSPPPPPPPDSGPGGPGGGHGGPGGGHGGP
jgi:eukaryotic-like serine/threonine-protein kinase